MNKKEKSKNWWFLIKTATKQQRIKMLSITMKNNMMETMKSVIQIVIGGDPDIEDPSHGAISPNLCKKN